MRAVVLRVNTRDGRTHTFDLAKGEDLDRWGQWQASLVFQERISGLSLDAGDGQRWLPLPRGFSEVSFRAGLIRAGNGEPIAAQATAVADDVSVGMTLYLASLQVRVDLRRLESRVPMGGQDPRRMEGQCRSRGW
jgi:hypothetical protein